MSLALAIADLTTTVAAISNLHVVGELLHKSRHQYELSISMAERNVVTQFGRQRVTQHVNLELTSIKPDTGNISSMMATIDNAVIADRRRGGQAQSTTNAEPWSVLDDTGRQGVVMGTTVGIIVYED